MNPPANHTASPPAIHLHPATAGPAGRDTPIRTIIRQNQEAGVEPLHRRELSPTLVASLIAAAVIFAAVAWWINASAKRAVSAGESAERTLMRRLRLGRAARALLPELERASGVPTLAMLASPTALRTAIEAPESASCAGRPGWSQLQTLAEGSPDHRSRPEQTARG